MSDMVSSSERVVSPSAHSFPQQEDYHDNLKYSSFNNIHMYEKKYTSNIPESHDIRDKNNPMPLTRKDSLVASYVTDDSSTTCPPGTYFGTENENTEIASFTGSLKQIVAASMVAIPRTPTNDFLNNDSIISPAVVSRNPSLKLSTDNPQPIIYNSGQSYRCAKDDDDDEEMSSRRSSSIKIDSEDDEDIDDCGELPALKIAASASFRWGEKQSTGPLPTPTRAPSFPQNPARQRRGAIGYSSLTMASAVLARLELGDEIEDDLRPPSRSPGVYQNDLLYPAPSLPQRTRSSPMLKRRFDCNKGSTDLNLVGTNRNATFESLLSPQNVTKESSDSSIAVRRNINKSKSFVCSGRETSLFSLSASERTNAKQTRTASTSLHNNNDMSDYQPKSGGNVSDSLNNEIRSSASSVSLSNDLSENDNDDKVLYPPKRRRAIS
jgi:hypothetical protein